MGESDRQGRRSRATVTGDGRGKKRGRQGGQPARATARATARAMCGSKGNGI